MSLIIPKKRSNKFVAEFNGGPLIELMEVNGLGKERGHIEHRDEFGNPEAYAGDEELQEVEFVTANPADTAIFAARLKAFANDGSFSVHIMDNNKVILESWIAENVVIKGLTGGALNRKTTNEFHTNTIKVVGVFTMVV